MSNDSDDANRLTDDGYGSRDLRYGHAFGTQRDRSEGEEGYLDTANDVWTEGAVQRGLRPGGATEGGPPHRSGGARAAGVM